MICMQVQEVYTLCRDFDVKIGSSDLLRLVCDQCTSQEVCPATLIEQVEIAAVHRDSDETAQPIKEV